MEDIKIFQDIFAVDFPPLFKTNLLQSYSPNKPYQHVLLVGAIGTVISSSVKALVNEYSGYGLRLVEVPIHSLKINELSTPLWKTFHCIFR